jgi:hypothetical protein
MVKNIILEIESLIEQYSLGNDQPGLGIGRPVCKGMRHLRVRNGGRVYFRKVDGKVEIVAKANKNNAKRVVKHLQRIYGN